jgi:RNA polymerase sigma-70 factor (ECF subfamily)
MSEHSTEQIRALLDSLYRADSGRILATLIRLLGDFDLAEEAMHEAFAAALSLWPQSGVPDNPRPWLISTARFKAIDTLRRRARFDASQDELARYLEAQLSSAEKSDEEDSLEDDRLRLIFTCCHPSLPPEARVALTLREVCGLTTEEIAKGLPHHSPYPRATHRARKGKDSRDSNSVRSAGAAGIAGATGRSASGYLSRL